MSNFENLDKRLKQAFRELPDPVLSDDLDARLMARLRNVEAVKGIDALESRLRAAFDSMPAPEVDYAAVARKLDLRIRETSARGRAIDAVAAPASASLSAGLSARLMRAIRNAETIAEEQEDDRFWISAWRFAAVLAPCSVAALFACLTHQTSLDYPIQNLFEENEAL
jgi:hypothetical protein